MCVKFHTLSVTSRARGTSTVKGLVTMWIAQNKLTDTFDKLASLQHRRFMGSASLLASS